MSISTMQHCNGHQICAITMTSSGPKPDYHELIEIAIIPLDHQLKIAKVMPFHMVMRPEYPERVDRDWIRKTSDMSTYARMEHGVSPFHAADMFDTWFARLGMNVQKFSGMTKKIMPLAYQYSMQEQMLKEWLGETTWEQHFHLAHRDVLSDIQYLNDRASFEGKACIPFQKYNLSYIANRLNIEHDLYRQPLQRARIIAEIYHQLCFKRFVL